MEEIQTKPVEMAFTGFSFSEGFLPKCEIVDCFRLLDGVEEEENLVTVVFHMLRINFVK